MLRGALSRSRIRLESATMLAACCKPWQGRYCAEAITSSMPDMLETPTYLGNSVPWREHRSTRSNDRESGRKRSVNNKFCRWKTSSSTSSTMCRSSTSILLQPDFKSSCRTFAPGVGQEAKGSVLYHPGSFGPHRFKLPLTAAELDIEDHSAKARVAELEVA